MQASTACVTTLQNQPALSCPSADIPQTHSTSMLCIEVMLLRDLPWACSCCAHHASLLRSNAERKLIAHAAASSKCFNVHREHLCSAWSLNGLPGLMQARASLEHILQQEISEGKAGIEDLRYTFLCSTTAMDTNKGCRLALTGYCLSRNKHHSQSFPLQLLPANCSVTAEHSSGHVSKAGTSHSLRLSGL